MHPFRMLGAVIIVLVFNSCDKTNYATLNDEYIGTWQGFAFWGNAWGYKLTLEISEEGDAVWTQEDLETGKTKKKNSGKFKIQNGDELRVGMKKFIITKDPKENDNGFWLVDLDSITYSRPPRM